MPVKEGNISSLAHKSKTKKKQKQNSRTKKIDK
jgi:hypothetical protein